MLGSILGSGLVFATGCGSLCEEDKSDQFDNCIYIESREECEDSNGIWFYWLPSFEESCSIRSGDYNLECLDSCECEGKCITSCDDNGCDNETGYCSIMRRYGGCTKEWKNGRQGEFSCFP